MDAEKVRGLFDYDPSTGILVWRQSRRGVTAGMPAGSVGRAGYVLIQHGRRRYRAHRLAWLHFHGKWPEKELDHINRVKTDNRIANLRDVSHAENALNFPPPPKRDLPPGVYQANKGPTYRTQYRLHGVMYYPGNFSTPEAASAAREQHRAERLAASGSDFRF